MSLIPSLLTNRAIEELFLHCFAPVPSSLREWCMCSSEKYRCWNSNQKIISVRDLFYRHWGSSKVEKARRQKAYFWPKQILLIFHLTGIATKCSKNPRCHGGNNPSNIQMLFFLADIRWDEGTWLYHFHGLLAILHCRISKFLAMPTIFLEQEQV